MIIAATWGTGQVFLEMLWFVLFFMWIWLAIVVFRDIFRSPDLSGWGKAIWSLFIIVLPFLGVFCYLIARGPKMAKHAEQEAYAQDQAMRAYIRDVVDTTPTAVVSSTATVDGLTALESLRNQGVIDNDEYQRLKAKANIA